MEKKIITCNGKNIVKHKIVIRSIMETVKHDLKDYVITYCV